MRVVIIGAGIVGASVAWNLARRGVEATVIDAGPVAGGASGRGFGWLNASFHLDDDHYHLRVAAMRAWERAEAALKSRALSWPGTLWWEEAGAAFDAFRDGLRRLDYPVAELSRTEIEALEPALAAPKRALRLPGEGVADLPRAARAMLAASGARVIAGCAVEAIEAEAGRLQAVHLDAGRIAADRVVVAAGTGAAALVAPLGVTLPMLPRPGLLFRTRPVARAVRHILVAPGQELRQDGAGRIVAPTAARHQGDPSSAITERPDLLADRALERIRALLPGVTLDWEEVIAAERPVPGDGRPVMGFAGPEGLYLAVMHSGATLGALAGELAAREITGGEAAMLAPYRPGRFAEA